jgi:hypothetical protein
MVCEGKSKTKDNGLSDAEHSQHNNKIALDRVSLNGWLTGQVNLVVTFRNELTDAKRNFRFMGNTKMLDDAISV